MKLDNYKIREELQKTYEKYEDNPHEFIKHIPSEIIVVAPPIEGPDCEKYALGTEGWRHQLSGIYPDINEPKQDDIVLYYSEEKGTPHVGRYQKDETVISKWGEKGPVLKHPIDFVPECYGDYVFFRRISEEEVKKLRKAKGLFDIIS